MTNFFKKIIGTISTIFQIGIGGPKLKKSSSSALDIRNSTDASFANVRVADPVADDDAVTQRKSKSAIRQIQFSLALVSTSSVSQIPAGGKAISAKLQINTAYSVGTTVSIGFTGTPTAFMQTTENDPTEVSTTWEIEQNTTVVSAVNVFATVAGSPIVGAAIVIVDYVIPEA